MRIVITPTIAAATVVMNFDRYSYDFPCYLYIIGTITSETVAIQRPTVADPSPTNDAHWVAVTEGNVTWSLSSTNSAQLIKGGITIRIVKTSSGSNAFGIGYM
jgi:hypothetical protein